MQEIVPNLYLGPYATANKNKVLHFVKTCKYVLVCVFMGVLLFHIIKTTSTKKITHKWKMNKNESGTHFFHFLSTWYMCVCLVKKCFCFLVRLFRVNRNNWYHLCQTYCWSKFHQTQFSREDQVGFLSTLTEDNVEKHSLYCWEISITTLQHFKAFLITSSVGLSVFFHCFTSAPEPLG